VFLNPQIAPEELQGKQIVLDILAVDETGKRFNIEMQTTLHAGWSSRSVYYLARALGDQLRSGGRYDHMQPVIGIHLMDFDLFPAPDQSCWTFELRDRQRPDVVLDRSLQLHMIELPKADRLWAAGASAFQASHALAEWVAYFKHWREETLMHTIARPAIQKAYQHLHALSGDDLARHQAFVRERALLDEITEKAVARETGLAEGRAEGLAEGRAEGIAIGEAKGFAQGQVQGQVAALRHLLHAKFGVLSSSVEQQLQQADSAQLERWLDRLLAARQLEDVFNH